MENQTHKEPDVFYYLSARAFLADFLEYKKQKNPMYSLRAFSKNIGISSASLSNYLNEKITLKTESYVKIHEGLRLNESESDYFSMLAQYEILEKTKCGDKVLSKIKEFNRIGWPDGPKEIESLLNQLEAGPEFRYRDSNTMRFRILAQLVNSNDGSLTPHFIDRFIDSNLEVAGIAYFIRNEDGTYRTYLKRGFVRDNHYNFLADENRQVEVIFDAEGFPEIRDFTIDILQCDLLMKGTIKFNSNEVHVTGYKFHPNNENHPKIMVNDRFSRI